MTGRTSQGIIKEFGVTKEEEAEFELYLKNAIRDPMKHGVAHTNQEELSDLINEYRNRPHLLAYAMFRCGYSTAIAMCVREVQEGLDISRQIGYVPEGFADEFCQMLLDNMLLNMNIAIYGPQAAMKVIKMGEHKDCSKCPKNGNCIIQVVVEALRKAIVPHQEEDDGADKKDAREFRNGP